jgi:hypothetical protein
MGLAIVAAVLVAATTVAVMSFDDHKVYATKDTTNKKNGDNSGTETQLLPVPNRGKIELKISKMTQ